MYRSAAGHGKGQTVTYPQHLEEDHHMRRVLFGRPIPGDGGMWPLSVRPSLGPPGQHDGGGPRRTQILRQLPGKIRCLLIIHSVTHVAHSVGIGSFSYEHDHYGP